jgi:ElaB/YqjD/DUF883 family membrane-anchored ribosome-binding protein
MSKTNTASQPQELLKKHAMSLLSATSHIADHKVAEARDKLSKIIETIGEGVEEVEDAALEKAKQAKNYMRSHPLKTVGIAVGVCVLVSLFMASRKK